MELSGRVAAITGASSGIGLAVARHLAREGVAVVLGARRTDRLEVAVQEIRAAGGRGHAVTIDVTSEHDTRRFVEEARIAFGRLDIMVCNAGFGYYGTVEDTPPDVMQRMMDVNFMGTYHATRAALPTFRQQGHGHVMIVSSIVGRRGVPQTSGYSASKAAQVGFAEALRAEFAGSSIHVSIVYPVSTETEFRTAMVRDYGHSVAGVGPKQQVDDVARAMVAGLRRPRPEVYPHRASRALAVMNVVAPGIADRLVKRYGRRRETSSTAGAGGGESSRK